MAVNRTVEDWDWWTHEDLFENACQHEMLSLDEALSDVCSTEDFVLRKCVYESPLLKELYGSK